MSPDRAPNRQARKADARTAAFAALIRFERGGGPAALLPDAGDDLAPNDRALFTTLVQGVLRHQRLLDLWIDHLRGGSVDPDARLVLRLGLLQSFILEFPEHAAVHETVNLAGLGRASAKAMAAARGFVNAILRRALRERTQLETLATQAPLAVRHSHPDFLFEKWRADRGTDQAEALMVWNNLTAGVTGRLNRLRGTPETLLETEPDAVPIIGHPDCFDFESLPNRALEAGLVYLQDPSTLMSVRLLDPQPGETVLDACAAPGGKTCHAADMMRNTGRIIATDSMPERNTLILQNTERLRIECVEVVRHDWLRDGTPEGVPGFDKILVDAPCSNTGVLRRRVDARWRLSPDAFERMPAIQLSILRAVAPLLKPNGTLVYSTCSIEPEENGKVVEAFLKQHSGWRMEESQTLFPPESHTDGAFAARLVRK